MQIFVDIHDSLNSLPKVFLFSLEEGKLLMTLYELPFPTPCITTPYGHLRKPKIERLENTDNWEDV
jgi:dipeptidyl-peptidase-4